ncbi:hypothetical protein IGI04_022741 [Brassica rapa subsp. trilocularis]|uniref:Amino acid transporter transmembrane domain-containing protein n=1 Tax=Brassica rapa subsp. trilocularis TaxID=1813537 RepID=A0ABQ7M1T8_BRACM|nr:hypothetical protein IGI04_022741 [Brassica rapa subsp. trilocularis]
MGSPPHSQSSMGRYSRESSSTRFSGSLKPGSRKVNDGSKRKGHGGEKQWKECAMIEEEGLLDDGERDRGMPRGYYVLAFIVGFFILFGLFSLILYGAAKPKITVKSITFETLKIQAGQDAGGVGTDMITMNATLTPREDYFQRAKPYKDHPTTARQINALTTLLTLLTLMELTSGFIGSRIPLMDQLYVGINGFPRQLYCFIPLPLALNLKTRDWIRGDHWRSLSC